MPLVSKKYIFQVARSIFGTIMNHSHSIVNKFLKMNDIGW